MSVSALSKLLETFVELCEKCENLNPLPGTHQNNCLGVCVYGGRCIDLLNSVDISIEKEREILSKLQQLDPGKIEKSQDESKKIRQCVQIWGQALEQLEKLKDAADFSILLLDEKTEISKGKKFRFEFRDKSLGLALNMLWELQEVIAGYKAKEYPNLRSQLVNSHLKDFRNMFVKIAWVQGHCYFYGLPDECKNHNLPDLTEGTLTVFHGRERHELTFNVGMRQPLEWHLDNKGLLDYVKLLGKIWDRDTGQPRFSKGQNSSVWVVDHPEGIDQLEEAASKICKVTQGLRSIKEYEELTNSIFEIARNGSRRWETCKVPWEYLNELDRMIAKHDRIPKQHQISTQELTDSQPQKNNQYEQTITIKDFINKYCDLSEKPDIISKREMLLREDRQGRITLPVVGSKDSYRQGQTYLYYLNRLLNEWSNYRMTLTTLPPLKKSTNK